MQRDCRGDGSPAFDVSGRDSSKPGKRSDQNIDATSQVSYNAVISACGDWQEAVQLLEEMKAQSVAPDLTTCADFGFCLQATAGTILLPVPVEGSP